MCVHWGQPSGSASSCKVSPSSGLPLLDGKTNQPIYYEDAPVSCRLCLMMGGGVLIKICSKAVRSHLHFWWSWWWWWQWWQWWRTLSHIDAQKPIYGIKCLWEFGCTPWWWWWRSLWGSGHVPKMRLWLMDEYGGHDRDDDEYKGISLGSGNMLPDL